VNYEKKQKGSLFYETPCSSLTVTEYKRRLGA